MNANERARRMDVINACGRSPRGCALTPRAGSVPPPPGAAHPVRLHRTQAPLSGDCSRLGSFTPGRPSGFGNGNGNGNGNGDGTGQWLSVTNRQAIEMPGTQLEDVPAVVIHGHLLRYLTDGEAKSFAGASRGWRKTILADPFHALLWQVAPFARSATFVESGGFDKAFSLPACRLEQQALFRCDRTWMPTVESLLMMADSPLDRAPLLKCDGLMEALGALEGMAAEDFEAAFREIQAGTLELEREVFGEDGEKCRSHLEHQSMLCYGRRQIPRFAKLEPLFFEYLLKEFRQVILERALGELVAHCAVSPPASPGSSSASKGMHGLARACNVLLRALAGMASGFGLRAGALTDPAALQAVAGIAGPGSPGASSVQLP